MRSFDTETRDLMSGWDQGQSVTNEARRIVQICNACRYCEGFCAVFPAMTRQRSFSREDLSYLGNLCHNCKGCYYACQYAAPHEFDVNFPRTMAELRGLSWHDNAWPGFMAGAFRRPFQRTIFFLLVFTLFFLVAAVMGNGFHEFIGVHTGGDFYALLPHELLIWTAGPVFLFSLLSMGISVVRFYRHAGASANPPKAGAMAVHDALTLKNLSGGGHGCNNHNEEFSMARRHLHHAVFYGFMLCFAATAVGTVYHYGFGWHAPYALISLPVLLGLTGGALLCIGVVGLTLIRRKADPEVAPQWLNGMETAFIGLLFYTTLSGLLLTIFRETAWMGALLVLHMGAVLTFFALLPYSKMVHGLYRLAALLRFHVDGKAGQ